MRILYMNQGGGGHHGAIKYSDYDIICLAESKIEKSGFDLQYTSKDSLPVMSVQTQEGAGRVIARPHDLDITAQHVRPIMTFTLKGKVINGKTVRVVFVHLKSANAMVANTALIVTCKQLRSEGVGSDDPILWIGDFNRAADPPVIAGQFKNVNCLLADGGCAGWDLDRAYISGNWDGVPTSAKVASRAATDHNHVAIDVDIG